MPVTPDQEAHVTAMEAAIWGVDFQKISAAAPRVLENLDAGGWTLLRKSEDRRLSLQAVSALTTFRIARREGATAVDFDEAGRVVRIER